jgi:glycosyltransferase involved in cell wall biosynthesis
MKRTFPPKWSSLNTALCHDWLTGMRGGERVLEILCEGFTNAPLYTLIHNRAAISQTINRHPIHTSWLQRIPKIESHYRHLLPLFPSAIEQFKPVPADLLISTSHCVAKNIRTTGNTVHLCYCFTPMRYAWLFHEEYLGANPLKRLIAKPILAWLRHHDRATSSRVTRFVAISQHVKARIKKFYGRESDVVYPPVDLDRWTPDYRTPDSFDLVASALVPYKRIDLAVRAYTRMGWNLKVVGVGSELAKLRQLAGPTIEFLGWQSDEQLLLLYRSCRALIFPGEEDFGIVPLEVQACGRPVIAYACGGALETVANGVSGIFFQSQTEESLIEAVNRGAITLWDPCAIRANAERFSVNNFIAALNESIEKALGAP